METKHNYLVSIKVESNIFITDVFSKPEAVRRAIAHFKDIIHPKIHRMATITATKTDTAPENLLDSKEVQTTSLRLANTFNKEELMLLRKDIEFYIGDNSNE